MRDGDSTWNGMGQKGRQEVGLNLNCVHCIAGNIMNISLQ